MINEYPTEDELRNRIVRQIEWRGPSDVVALIWRGYLVGLVEWGAIEFDVYTRLCALLPDVGYKEVHELSLDEPISREREKELDEFVRQSQSPQS